MWSSGLAVGEIQGTRHWRGSQPFAQHMCHTPLLVSVLHSILLLSSLGQPRAMRHLTLARLSGKNIGAKKTSSSHWETNQVRETDRQRQRAHSWRTCSMENHQTTGQNTQWARRVVVHNSRRQFNVSNSPTRTLGWCRRVSITNINNQWRREDLGRPAERIRRQPFEPLARRQAKQVIVPDDDRARMAVWQRTYQHYLSCTCTTWKATTTTTTISNQLQANQLTNSTIIILSTACFVAELSALLFSWSNCETDRTRDRGRERERIFE